MKNGSADTLPGASASSFKTSFKDSVTEEERAAKAKRFLERYPDSVPIICEKYSKSTLLELENRKFIVPRMMTVSEFKQILQKHLKEKMAKEPDSSKPAMESFQVFCTGNIEPNGSTILYQVHDTYKDKDGFLYLKYSSSNCFGQ